jgi:hypothetical protein
MPAVTAAIGISSFTSGTISKVTTSRKTETKVLKDRTGAFSAACTYDPTGEFSVEGSGDYPSITLGVASSNIPSTISGGIIVIDSYSKTEKNDDFASWKYSGKQFPAATA